MLFLLSLQMILAIPGAARAEAVHRSALGSVSAEKRVFQVVAEECLAHLELRLHDGICRVELLQRGESEMLVKGTRTEPRTIRVAAEEVTVSLQASSVGYQIEVSGPLRRSLDRRTAEHAIRLFSRELTEVSAVVFTAGS